MNDGRTTTQLTPHFGRAYVRVLLATVLVTVLGAVSERYRNGHWWTVGYCESLAIPLLLFSDHRLSCIRATPPPMV